jgi:licD2 protein
VKRHDTSVFVDVFPVEQFDDIKVIDKAHLCATLRMISYIQLQYVQYGDSKLKDFCRKIMWYLLRPVNPRFFGKRIEKLINKYRNPSGQYEGLIGCGKDGRKEVFPAGMYKELIEVPFEDMMVPIPKNYDEFLTQFYGDYMQIPSQEEIDYKSHGIKAYWKEK